MPPEFAEMPKGFKMDVCGKGVLGVADLLKLKNDRSMDELAARLQERQLAALQGSTDPLARMVAATWSSFDVLGQRDPKLSQEENWKRTERKIELARLPAELEAVQLANSADTAHAYAYASSFCSGHFARGPCVNLRLDRWLALEPDNAAALVARAAQLTPHAPADADALMIRASNTGTWRTHEQHAWRALAQADVAQNEQERQALLGTLSNGFLPTANQFVLNYEWCSRSKMELSAQRRTACGRMAELVYAQASTLANMAWASAIGELTGWPPERRHKRDALVYFNERTVFGPSALAGEDPAFDGDLASCGFSNRMHARMIERAHLGEVAALQQRMTKSSMSYEQWLEKAQAERRRRGR
jgi:hypothetical protein